MIAHHFLLPGCLVRFLAFLVILSSNGLAQTLVRDINQQSDPMARHSDPAFFALSSGIALMAATTPDHGRELWRTDGTRSGTRLVRDINPGSQGSSPREFAELPGGPALFFAWRASLGYSLWRTDGTFTGTQLVRDIHPGTGHLEVGPLYALGAQVLFFLDDGSRGVELWRSDGTERGTELVREVIPGSDGLDSPDPEAAVVGDQLFFRGPGGLWRSDGTSAGTVLVAAMSCRHLTAWGDRLAFAGRGPTTGWEPWVSDGTAAGTRLLLDIMPQDADSDPEFLGELGGFLLFRARHPTKGVELWRSNGTAAGTRLIANITPGPRDSHPRKLGRVGDLMVLSVEDLGRSTVWVTDGTSSGTQLLGGATSAEPGVASGGLLYFPGAHPRDGWRLWATDGTAAGTRVVSTARPAYRYRRVDAPVPVPGGVVFEGFDRVLGDEPWFTDGTDAGTTSLGDLNPNPVNLSSFPRGGRVQDRFLFWARDEEGRLWASDGTAAETRPLAVDPVQPFGWLDIVVVDEIAYFWGSNGSRSGIWKSDGTEEGTENLLFIEPGFQNVSLIGFGQHILFVGHTSTHGAELWISDGTAAGTRMVADVMPGAGSSDPRGLRCHEGVAYFSALDPILGRELHRTDGTRAGTYVVADVNRGSAGSVPGPMASRDGLLYFSANDGLHGFELWRTDGTQAGTVLVADLVPGAEGSFPSGAVELDRALVFSTREAGIGRPVWRTDGTRAGTYRLRSGPTDSGLWKAATRRAAYFTETTPDHRTALWKTDGLAAGTMHVVTLDHVEAGTMVSGSGDRMLFVGDDGVMGREVWVTDGTSSGTRRLTDINPGSGDSAPGAFARVGNQMFFSATDGEIGQELYVMPLSLTGEFVVESYGRGWSGIGGQVPRICHPGDATVGGFELRLCDARPDAFALLAASAGRGRTPLDGGGMLYLGGPLTLLPTHTDSSGQVRLRVNPSQTLLGSEVCLQYFIQDAGAVSGLSATAGMEIVIGE